MKFQIATMVACIVGFSMDAQACKMTAAGADAKYISSASQAFASYLKGSDVGIVSAAIVGTVGDHRVEMRAENGKRKTYKVKITPDCEAIATAVN